jgi:hypothetical protein
MGRYHSIIGIAIGVDEYFMESFQRIYHEQNLTISLLLNTFSTLQMSWSFC